MHKSPRLSGTPCLRKRPFAGAGWALALAGAFALAGCAGGVEGGLQAGADVVAMDPSPDLASDASADLLTRARRIASAKGFGAAPDTPPAHVFSGAMPASGAAPPAPAGLLAPAEPVTARTEEASEDLMARIKLAALRMRSAREEPAQSVASARGSAQPGSALASPEAPEAADPREIFRRAQARAREQASRHPPERAFGKLSPETASALASSPSSAKAASFSFAPSSYFMEAIRLREAPAGVVPALGPLSSVPSTRMDAQASHAKMD